MRTVLPRHPSAFTLLELLAAMAILLIIMAALWQVSDQLSRTWQLGERRTEVNQNARLLLETIATELECAVASSNSPTGVAVGPAFLHDEDSGILPGISSGVITSTPPNDQIFFISSASDTTGQAYADLCEYGYMVVYVRSGTNAYTMQGGAYYLLRHQARTSSSGWDFMNGAPTNDNWGTGWPTTPQITDVTKTPILDNVLRFELSYETRGIAPSNSLFAPNGTRQTDTWRNQEWYVGSGGPEYPSDYGIMTPEYTLPNAVHIRLTVVDRRSAARASAIIDSIASQGGTWTNWANGIPFEYLDCIPYSPAGESFLTCTTCPWTNAVVQPLRTVLRQGVQTYYRTVNLRNAK